MAERREVPPTYTGHERLTLAGPDRAKCGYAIRHHLLDEDLWVCSLSPDHEGDHYLIRAQPAGRISPVPPDPERDRRRAAYKALERENARKALDMWFQAVDERLVPKSAQMDLARTALIGSLERYAGWGLHHKGNYGITASSCYGDGHDRDHEDMQGVSEG